MSHRPFFAAALTAASLLPLAACGSDTPAAVSGPTMVDTGSAGVDPVGSTVGAEAETTVATADDGGSCSVEITGDVNASFTSGGGYSAVGYGSWIPPEPGVSTPFELDGGFFLLNCIGPGDTYVGFGAALDADIPMAPATYPIVPATTALGGSDIPHQIDILVGIDGSDTNWGPTEGGSLVITEFDADNIAGTFTVPITDVLASITGENQGNAMITGSFNFANPNL